jgi:hypothetical protein
MGVLGGSAPGRNDIEFAAARGLAYLKGQQDGQGSYRGTPYQVAAQGLAGLAFLSSGYTPRHGPYAVELRLGLRNLLKRQRPDGCFADGHSLMYGHGFATLYCAEVVGMWGVSAEETELRDALGKAIRLIEAAQDATGGWDYEPQPGGVSDCSVTVCQAMALRAARNIGLHVEVSVVERALAYVRRAQDASGGFRYRVGGTGARRLFEDRDRVTIGCSAAGLCILNGLGDYDSEAVRRGLEYLRGQYRTPYLLTPFYYYTHYYAVQAFLGTRGGDFEAYYAHTASTLLDRQEDDGSWRSAEAGPIPSTAMAVFILNAPQAVLPILQKD